MDFLDLTRGQVVLIVLLTAAFNLIFSFWMIRIEQTSNPEVVLLYWGFPFDAIRIKNTRVLVYNYRQITIDECYWGGIIIDALIYMAFSIILVKLATLIRDEVEYRKYYKT